jgi:uncharacterized phiE125 gp8 family phage protein
MNLVQTVGPTIEPITLAELKTHLRIDSSSMSDNIDEVQSIAPGEKAIAVYTGTAVEVLGYNAAVEFAAGLFAAGGITDVEIQDSDDNVTFNDWPSTTVQAFTQVTTDGMLTSAALSIGSTPQNVANGIFTYFIAGVPYSKPAYGAGTALGIGTILQNKFGAVAFDIGANNTIDVVPATGNAAGYTTAAFAVAGLPVAEAGHVRMGNVTVKSSAIAGFIFGTTSLADATATVAYTQATLKANYSTTYEKAYTGIKRYIRAIATVTGASCSLGISVIRSMATVIEDTLLTDNITAVREHVEDITRRALLTQTWRYYLDEFPCENFIKIPFGNLQTVTSIKYKGSDWLTAADDVTLIEGTDYIVETNGEGIGRIVLPYGGVWPSVILYPSNPICIEIVCGWTTALLVPYKIKAAMKMLCEDLYNHRDAKMTQAQGNVTENKAVMNLLASARLYDEF